MVLPRLLRRGDEPTPRSVPKGQRIYDEAVREALTVIWEASDRICGKRLKAALPSMVESLERHGHLDLDPGVRRRLFSASAATIDRLLRPIREQAGSRRKRKQKRKMGSRIQVRTFSDWKEPEPGYLEIDLVAHCGGTVTGSYISSLVVTDVCSGWTEAIPLLVREQTLVVEGLEAVSRVFPVPIRGINSDNDSVFINETLAELLRGAGHRVHPLAGVPQERPGVDRAEERFRGTPLRGTRALLGTDGRSDYGPPVWCDAVVREPLPALVPAAGAESGGWDREEEIQHASHSLRPPAVA